MQAGSRQGLEWQAGASVDKGVPVTDEHKRLALERQAASKSHEQNSSLCSGPEAEWLW